MAFGDPIPTSTYYTWPYVQSWNYNYSTTTKVVEETMEYDENGKMIRKTVKTTTTTHPSYPQVTHQSPTISSSTTRKSSTMS